VEREYSSDSAISQTGRAFTDKIDTNPKKVNSSCKHLEAKGNGVQPRGCKRAVFTSAYGLIERG
jgi:hypothetical protein